MTANGCSLAFAGACPRAGQGPDPGDAGGNLKTLTWPDGKAMTYAFDLAGRFSSVGNGGASVGAGYDTLSRMNAIDRGASTSAIGFDAADRMKSLAHAFTPASGNEAWGFTFTPASQTATASTSNPPMTGKARRRPR